MKLLSPILIALLLVTAACNTHLSREARLSALPTTESIDPATDTTIGLLYDTVPDLTDTQLYALTNLYIQLREGQESLITQIKDGQGGQSKRGGRDQQAKEGKRPRKRMDGERPNRSQRMQASQSQRAEVRKKFHTLEQTFLNAGKALLLPNQHAGWEAFVTEARLEPKRPSSAQGRSNKRGKADMRDENNRKRWENRPDRDSRRRGEEGFGQDRVGQRTPQNPSAVVSQTTLPGSLNHGEDHHKTAPAFILADLDGVQHAFATLTGKPLIVTFGSFTDPDFRETYPPLEKLIRAHEQKINFVIIYGAESYPSDETQIALNTQHNIHYTQPKTMAERIAIASAAQKALNMKALLLIDDMENSTTENWNGSKFTTTIVNADGTIHTNMEKTELSLIRDYLETL